MDTIRIEVRSDRATYPVAVGAGLLPRLSPLLRDTGLSGQITLVTSAPIWRLHGPRLGGLLGADATPVLIGDGERAKTLTTVARVYEAFASRGVDRSGVVIAFGGGVVGDVAGYAAATFLRGIRLVQVPTTLLAQVDSAIGGKVGVNLSSGKNLVGAFHPPSLVVCDPDVLVSLPRREFRSGLYEVVKYGVIASRPLLERVAASLDDLFAHDRTVLIPVIAECARIKADVVSRDEREAGPRRVLNFGHTIGHAIEAATKYRRFRHGEAIALGMRAAAHISASRGRLSAEDHERLQRLLHQLGPLPAVDAVPIADVLEAIGRDKKIANGRLHFVLAAGIGATQIVDDVSTDELTAALRAIGLR